MNLLNSLQPAEVAEGEWRILFCFFGSVEEPLSKSHWISLCFLQVCKMKSSLHYLAVQRTMGL